MLLQFFLLLFLLFLLFFTTRRIVNLIYQLCLYLSGNQRFSFWFLAIILLPGTIIHELSHFLVATILRVPTGELTVFPTFEKKREVKAGKLELGKSDPFRLSLIGLSPIFIGLFLIYLIGKIFSLRFPQLPITNYQLPNLFFLFSFFYLLFAISVTMFTSKKDLESLIIVGPITSLFLVSLYLIGARVYFEEKLLTTLEKFFSELNLFLLLAAGIDLLVLTFLAATLTVTRKLAQKR